MVTSKIEDTITLEIDITEMLNEADEVIIKVIKDDKTIKVDHYRRRNGCVKKRRINEN